MVPPRSLVSARWQLFGIAEETSWGAFLYQIYQKWIIDTNDLHGFFVSYPKPDTLDA